MDTRRYATSAELTARYSINIKTLYRWEKDEKLGFPKAVKLNGRNLYPVEAVEAWERQRASRRAAA